MPTAISLPVHAGVEGYAVRAGDGRRAGQDLMNLTDWKQHIPKDHKLAVIGQLLSKTEAIDEDDVLD